MSVVRWGWKGVIPQKSPKILGLSEDVVDAVSRLLNLKTQRYADLDRGLL